MNSAATPRPWLARLHPGLFGIVLGLLALSSAWRRLVVLGWAGAELIASGLQSGGLALLALLLALTAAKLLRFPHALLMEYHHPVQGAMLALMPVSCLLAVIVLLPQYPAWLAPAQAVIALALLLQAAISWQIVSRLSTGQMPAELVSPALYLPIVPGGFVGAIAMKMLGLHGFAMLLFGMGLGGWALLEIRILNRLFSGPLPLALRPTLGIEIAPAAVGTLSAISLWPELSADILMLGLGISSGPVLAVLTRWRWWSSTPFSFGFWSFSFPLAAMASCVAEAVRRGGWPPEVALMAVLLVSLLVAFLTVRTVLQLVQGKLLPA
ncbi:MAG: hypothetical protein HYZ65_14505 [Burkholderiales bacterium]|nr:hypothetical protein [Burkholderiales bacterium]